MLALGTLAVAGCASPSSEPERPDPRDRFESPILFPGYSWSYTFESAAHQPYRCEPHPWMEGVVHVVDGSPRPLQTFRVAIFEAANGTWGFSPANVTVQPGDTVEWLNEGREFHTVTRLMGHTGPHETKP